MSEDDRIRNLLEDAVADVEPRPALDTLRERTRRPARNRGWAWAVGGTVLATAATVAVVVALTSSPGTTGADPSPADGGSEGSGLFDDSVTGPVYFVGETGHGPRLFPEPHRYSDGDQVGQLQLAIDGKAADADYRSYWPAGTTVKSIRADHNSPEAPVVVDLSGPSLTERPTGVTTAQAQRSVQQVVWTVRTSTYPQGPVDVRVDGEPVRDLLGVPVTSPLDAGAAEDVLAQVQVNSPVDGSTWSGSDPITVDGEAASFEANVQWELKQGDTVVKQGFTTAQECCTLSPFSFPIPLPAPGRYTLVVHDDDPSGGEGGAPWQDTKDITVR